MRGNAGTYWNLVREFTVCGFKIRDQGTVLGFCWTLLHPLLLLVVLYTLFKDRLGGNIPHFRVYLLIGIIHWSYFSTATTKAVTSIVLRRDLVTHVSFPREILVIGDVGTILISFVLEMAVLFLFLLVEGIPPRLVWMLMPLVIGLQTMLIVAFSLFLASLQVFVKDIERIWTIILRIGFFAVPIFYQTSMIQDPYLRWVLECNPLTQLMEFSRGLLIDGALPSPTWILYTLAFSTLLLTLTLWMFKKLEYRFAERL